MDWYLDIYKYDKRTKIGTRKFNSYRYVDKDEKWMNAEVADLQYKLYPAEKFILKLSQATKIVKNLVTGKDIEIDSKTPHCCDPSTETYWSM